MTKLTYWENHYVVETSTGEIERNLKLTSFTSEGKNFELIYFSARGREKDKGAPNILISQGSGGHAYVFAELGYLMHLKEYNVFIMPKHGGHTITELVERHRDALMHITRNFNERIGVFAEGLGGFAVFYLALADNLFKSAVYQNSPGLLTEKKFQNAIIRGRRKALMPFTRFIFRISPRIKLPISSYLDWKELIDTKEPSRTIESRLVVDGYLQDPDFDTWYPLSAILSLLNTPPPQHLLKLHTPTMFMVAARGFCGSAYADYLKDLYDRLPPIKKKMIEIDGSVYWMLSHPTEAAEIICEWFDKTL